MKSKTDWHEGRTHQTTFTSEDYSGAEELLRGLVQERFEVPSNHFRLVRVMLMMDRDEEAQMEITQARATRVCPLRSSFSHQLLDFTKQAADGLVKVRRQGAVPEANLRASVGSGEQ